MSTFSSCAMLSATLHPELAAYRWPEPADAGPGTDELAEETVATLVANLPETPAELIDLVEPAGTAAQPGLVEPPAVRSDWLVRALSFGRFVLVGGLSTAVSSLLFLLIGAWMPAALANTVATVLTTVGSNQAHARWTFNSGRRGAGMHLRAGLSVAITYPLTTLALLGLDRVHPDAGSTLELAVLLGASAVAGLVRYVLLLVGVFPDSPAAFDRDEAPATDAAAPAAVAADYPTQLVAAGSRR
jgi:putative flippase GtrA